MRNVLFRYRVVYDAVVQDVQGDTRKVDGAVAIDALDHLSGPEFWDCVANYLWTTSRCKAKQISILYVGKFYEPT